MNFFYSSCPDIAWLIDWPIDFRGDGPRGKPHPGAGKKTIMFGNHSINNIGFAVAFSRRAHINNRRISALPKDEENPSTCDNRVFRIGLYWTMRIRSGR